MLEQILGLCWAHLGAMLTHLGPILGASVGSSWGTFCAICVDTGPSPKNLIMHVRAVRITDTTLVKPTVFAFRHCPNFGSSKAHKTVKSTVFLNTTHANHSGTAAETHQHQPPASARAYIRPPGEDNWQANHWLATLRGIHGWLMTIDDNWLATIGW